MDRRKEAREYYKKNTEKYLARKANYAKTRDFGLYSRYISIKSRCKHKTNKRYPDYGGRGIKMLWKSYDDFKQDMLSSFLEHANKNGSWQTTIERIDVNGNYCKENCVWVTRKRQAENKRNTLYLDLNGVKTRIRDLYNSSAKVSYMAFKHRIVFLKWSVEKALSEPRMK